jgi:large subunit ribosomal protein L4
MITDQVTDNLHLASRNIPGVAVIEPRETSPLALVHFDKVLVTKAALDQLKEMFA